MPALKMGDGVAIVAPASTASDKVDEAERWLTSRGFAARVMPATRAPLEAPFEYLAGTDDARLGDLHAAFAAPDIGAVWCLRGGFGSSRLVDKIDYALLRANPKPFIGYSDITALHAAIQRHAGFVTFHGPMLSSDLLVSKRAPTEMNVFAMIKGGVAPGEWIEPPPDCALVVLVSGAATGRLVGGNLSMHCSMLGTPYEVDTADTILFIEDVGETPSRIDRLLTQLRLAGKLSTVKGVLVGSFTELGQHPEDLVDPSVLHPLLRQTFEPLGIPVLAGWPSGHGDPNLTLPLGAQVRIDTTRRALRLEQPVAI
ncbi:LD-carboxypeptidase [Ralstonia solanacearum]|uniref:S66 peptidase family protein n=1 Tax=Ralstonia solanacearum TaxID=305 RepID=UPI0005C636AA|nr:LD-carboxypeptidase [Ralstonia solanacearum]MDB0544528.1 LD-carboxypeptidase [Ralstonia solanacearum]MDB0554401.1 LD-carboxypeptidase [Ralstonia solanacearum]MDB0559448.1 LD-carboxypeptidase [Ralstonia solanacearum]